MSNKDITLIAAVIAASVSLLTLLVTVWNTRAIELRAARRDVLAPKFCELGSKLYSLIALSVKMTQAKTDKTFAKTRTQADEIASDIDNIRRELRYPLWGIDDGFRTIQWIPVYMAHLKAERKGNRAKILLKYGTDLRELLDKAILYTYFTGNAPTSIQRWKIMWKAWMIRKYFDHGAPKLSD